MRLSRRKIGGGFVRDEDEIGLNAPAEADIAVPFAFASAADLLDKAATAGLSIAGLVLANEIARRPEAQVQAGLDEIAQAMFACIGRGVRAEGVLPGGLKVHRRARQVLQSLISDADKRSADPLAALDWVNLWALAGLLPAVLRYYDRFHNGTLEGRRAFLLTAAAIGSLYKTMASISGAEVGCQIGRNAMGAVKAIDATRLALLGDGEHTVSLDKVIATMKRTGEDMNAIYKETSLGGLAVNLVEC